MKFITQDFVFLQFFFVVVVIYFLFSFSFEPVKCCWVQFQTILSFCQNTKQMHTNNKFPADKEEASSLLLITLQLMHTGKEF